MGGEGLVSLRRRLGLRFQRSSAEFPATKARIFVRQALRQLCPQSIRETYKGNGHAKVWPIAESTAEALRVDRRHDVKMSDTLLTVTTVKSANHD
jgi:hypothetical protein